MITECRFWTTNSEVNIKSTDLGAFRYHHEGKKEIVDSESIRRTTNCREAKGDYSLLRGHAMTLNNKGPQKLKDAILKLEELIRSHPPVYQQWRDNAVLRLMLQNGLLIHICINVLTGSILRIAYDKYFVGKIAANTITDVLITKMHIVIAYNENQITFVYLQKPSTRRSAPENISRMEPKIFHIIIGGPSSTQGRRLTRHISCNASFDMIAIWTKSSQNEVYPWRPTVRDKDRANIHIYKLNRSKLDPLLFHWTENDPLCVQFSRAPPTQLKIVEQRVTRKGEVFIEDQVYEIMTKGRLQRTGITSIPLPSEVCCLSYSDQDKLVLGCIDGSICLFDASRGLTHIVRAGFIPTVLSWHRDSALILVGSECGQIQFYDLSLACLKSQLASEDLVPTSMVDLSVHFTYQPTLKSAIFNENHALHLTADRYAPMDSFIFVAFEGGPLACIKMYGTQTSGYTADVLIQRYLVAGQVQRAINLLLCLNWDVSGAMCLIALHKITNYIYRYPLTAERESQLEKALGSFHTPVKMLNSETESEFGEQVNDIMRKFFHYLLRYKAYEKAFALALDINHDDLFVDLYNAAKIENDEPMGRDAIRKAQEILRHSDENQSTCSHSSCSYCASAESLVNLVSDKDTAPSSPIKRPDIVQCSSSTNSSPRNSEPPSHSIPLPTRIIGLGPSTSKPIQWSAKPLLKVLHKDDNDYQQRQRRPPNKIVGLTVTNETVYDNDNVTRTASKILLSNNRQLGPPTSGGVHAVIGVTPKETLDQTIGIPETISDVRRGADFAPLPASLVPSSQFPNYNHCDRTCQVVHQYPLVSGHIPPARNKHQTRYTKLAGRPIHKLDPAAVVHSAMATPSNTNYSGGIGKSSGEKNKVKFSDTITVVAVVPEINRKEKSTDRHRSTTLPLNLQRRAMYTNPRKELADSLPLCHPNEDYLKDFQLQVKDDTNAAAAEDEEDAHRSPGTIKVIHFGVV